MATISTVHRPRLALWSAILLAGFLATLTGCGGGGGDSGSGTGVVDPPPEPTESTGFYVADYANNRIRSFSSSPNTSTFILTEFPSISAGIGPAVGAAIFSKCYYFPNEGSNNVGVYVSSAAKTGLNTPSFTVTGNLPYAASLSDDSRFLAVSNYGDNTISQFSINPATCALTTLAPPLATQGNGPSWIESLTADRILVAESISNTVRVYQRNTATGVISASAVAITVGAFPINITKVFLNNEVVAVYSANRTGNSISKALYNLKTGLFTGPVTTIATDKGPEQLGPIALPNGKQIMVGINRFENTVTVYQIDPATGDLTKQGASLATSTGPNRLNKGKDGFNFIYVTHRNSTAVNAYRVDQTTGALTALGSAL